MKISTSILRQLWTAARATALLVALLGLAYPLAVTAAGQSLFPAQANGSLLEHDGQTVGSALLGQAYLKPDGSPDPRYFQPRPSAADFDALASGGSNAGPNDPQLTEQVVARRAQVAAFNQVPAAQVPADAVTASFSGLDPDISPDYALLQAKRVAAARLLPPARVQELVHDLTRGPEAGFLGAGRVNVLELNLQLDAMKE
ncbi:potassium-transporting ATPase subunit KdpC [Glutamicibacter ardleyensis]|uniref:potassium-transporting ATPase subunit KdpC n=1 Tax=Glutamicibacter ardleyensis TaxID=225894 RepID=UPI003FD38F61